MTGPAERLTAQQATRNRVMNLTKALRRANEESARLAERLASSELKVALLLEHIRLLEEATKKTLYFSPP